MQPWLTKQKSHEIFRFHGIFWCSKAIQIRTISLGCNFCRFSKGDGLCTFFIVKGYQNLIIIQINRIDECIHQCLPLVFQTHVQLAEPQQPEADKFLFDFGLCQLFFGGNRIGNQDIAVFQLPDVAAIVQHMLNGVEGHQPTTLVLDAFLIQPVPDFPHGLTIVVPLKGLSYKRRGQGVNLKTAVGIDRVSKGDCTAGELALEGILGHTANHFLGQVSRVIFGVAFQHRFQNDALRPLGDDLGSRHELDTVFLQLGLVPGTVVAIPGKAVELPDNDDVKDATLTVLDHLLELRAVIGLGRDGTVNVVLDHRNAILFGIGRTFTNLAFNGFFTLVIR